MPPSAPDTVIPAGSGPVSGAASGSGLEDSRRSRKPANTKFKQQQLPAWQPMLTARSVLPFLVAIGVAFIPIGIALYLSASNVTEITLPYTDCLEFRNEPDGTGHGAMCRNVTVPPGSKPCSCREKFTVTQDVVGPVFIYYALDNFFQNHRKYVKSRDDAQLMGNFVAPDKDANKGPSSDCAPFAMANNTWGYAPCGAIANSLFNDTIKLNYHGTADNSSNVKSTLVGLLKTGIAWTTDKKVKFRNPDNAKDRESLKAECDSKRLTKPPYWDKELWDLDKENFSNNGLQNEDLIVWMRTAAFPSFRKLYRRINHTTDDIFQHGLPAGNYSIDIEYKFPVTAFDGKKYVIISSVSWIGGKNPFLGIAYMTVGSACLLLAAVFFFIHVKWGKNYESHAFAGLTVDTPFHRRALREVFRMEPDHSTSDSRSPLSSRRWLDTIPSTSEPVSSRSAGESATPTTTTQSSFQGGRNRNIQFGQDSPRDDVVTVEVLSSLGGLRTGQTIYELLNDMLAKVTVVNAGDSVDLRNMRSSPRKSIIRPEELTEREVRIRRRQLMDQPVLVD